MSLGSGLTGFRGHLDDWRLDSFERGTKLMPHRHADLEAELELDVEIVRIVAAGALDRVATGMFGCT